jgi:hypothetical protein
VLKYNYKLVLTRDFVFTYWVITIACIGFFGFFYSFAGVGNADDISNDNNDGKTNERDPQSAKNITSNRGRRDENNVTC